MKCSIYHATNTRDSMAFHPKSTSFGFEHIKAMIRHGEYSHVADIECGGLEDAHRLSNNINELWIKNEEVTSISELIRFAGGCRSTSVGDIISADGKLYVVSPFGFEELNK